MFADKWLINSSKTAAIDFRQIKIRHGRATP